MEVSHHLPKESFSVIKDLILYSKNYTVVIFSSVPCPQIYKFCLFIINNLDQLNLGKIIT